MEHIDVEEYREELVLSLSYAREFAAANIKTAQKEVQIRPGSIHFKAGGLVLVRFPHEESDHLDHIGYSRVVIWM